jgi:malonyl-CoA/methylmalonyl-CoA synthetase
MSDSLLLARFLEVTRERGAHVAVDDDWHSVTFTNLAARAHRVAAELSGRGFGNDVRVAMLVTQSARWMEAFFGIALAGGIAVPLSHLHPVAEQRWFVEASGARAIIVSEDLEPLVQGYAAPRPVLRIEELQRSPLPPLAPASRRGDDTAVILYTSGTTGKPKGALISHDNLAYTARLVAEAWRWSNKDVLLHALPLHHLHGLGISLFVSLLAGSRTRMLSRFDAARAWEEMGRATVLMGVPTMHKKLLDALDTADPSARERWREHAAGLRLVTSGSAALPLSVGERWRELTGHYPLERFGMTEIGVGLSNPIDGERRPGTCGKPLPGMQIRIVSEDRRDAAPGDPGEIWIRGPSVFKGYDGAEQVTREAFCEGWFRSGDTATWTDDGYVKILGRASIDILKSGGYKLSALEIEEVLREHDAIADVAVVGIPDETWGDLAVAAVVARPGREQELEEETVRTWTKQRLAPYKVPKRIVLLDDFPRNAVGKVMKPELIRVLADRFELSSPAIGPTGTG